MTRSSKPFNEPIVPSKDNSLFIEVMEEQLDDMLARGNGDIELEIHEDTYSSLLENVDGHLLLCCDELPTQYFAYYFYNNGQFPYLVKKDLLFITLLSPSRTLYLRIVGYEPMVKERCDYLGSSILKTNTEGLACIWRVRFNVELCSQSPRSKDNASYLPSSRDEIISKHRYNYSPHPVEEKDRQFFLLRWNPAISSMTLDRYHNGIEQDWDKKYYDWSIYDWQEARKDDMFFMIRQGDDLSAGLVFLGLFASDPFVGEDWQGSSHPRHYCILRVLTPPSPAFSEPYIPIDLLEKHIPQINWRKGHSGEKIHPDYAVKILQLFEQIVNT